jgi:hypothetical protein
VSRHSEAGTTRYGNAVLGPKLLRLLIVTVTAVLLLAAGCGGKSSSDQMVWCVAPGEKVTDKLKREYPDLYMNKAACDAVNNAAP